ncbi:tetratricopeptide repeat protein [Nocardia asiatica]|uniref:tetratricopeptide repeat protein n=1 Tax=Nocardia asiatica TaxID=209252 RepID=UPI003EDF85C6
MGGRLALVVGSECAALPQLNFPERLATDLYGRLNALGGWESTRLGDGPLVNPTAGQLFEEVTTAFTMASQQQAALLISFIGHGVATGTDNFFLLAHDSPPQPTSMTGLHLIQVISEQLDRHTVDGLILLIDACETQHSLEGAAQRLTDRIELAARRVELLVATGREQAYDGCFTRTTLSVFEEGLPTRGENLLPADLLDPLEKRCPQQVAGHLRVAHGGDPGLWLVPNMARADDAVRGRPAAGLVDQLTNGVMVTATVRRRIAEVFNDTHSRLRGIIGPAGSGKSTLIALLIRPNLLARPQFTANYVAAAAFVSAASSLETLTTELSEQLRHRVEGFAKASNDASSTSQDDSQADTFDINIIEPLSRIDTFGSPINIVIDGLDQAEPGTLDLIETAIAKLNRRKDLAHVKLIVGIRADKGIEDRPAFAEMHRIRIPAPALDEIASIVATTHDSARTGAVAAWRQRIAQLSQQTAGSSWLVARLLTEVETNSVLQLGDDISVDRLVEQRVRNTISRGKRKIAPILAVLAAAGAGPVLPIELLIAALTALKHPFTVSALRDSIVAVGSLISRGSPGTHEEMLGIAHDSFIAPLTAEAERLGVTTAAAHHALTVAIRTITGERTDAYARGSGVRHFFACDRPTDAMSLLQTLQTSRAADNRDMWASWLPLFEETLGLDHATTLLARSSLASCRGESGDPDNALAEFHRVLTDQRRILGPAHPDTFTTRSNLASWYGRSGQLAKAVAELDQLLIDQLQALGPDHPDILTTRGKLAYWCGRCGDPRAAIAAFEELLREQLQTVASDHPDTFPTRSNIAYWHGEAGDPVGAVTAFQQLLADQLRVLGPDHPDTLTTRSNIAYWRGESGAPAQAVAAEFEQLIIARSNVLGPHHPNTLNARCNLAHWRGMSEGPASAITSLVQLLADQLRMLGWRHPDTFITRANLAYWRGMNEDFANAAVELNRLLHDQLQTLGPGHPSTQKTRKNLAHWQRRMNDVLSTATKH